MTHLERQDLLAEELCGATLRALSGDPSIEFRGHRLWRGDRALQTMAPHLAVHVEGLIPAVLRGTADAIALRLRLSDAHEHERLIPDDPVEALIFDLLEQIRVESLVHDCLPGVRRNLQVLFERWTREACSDGLLESERGMLVFAVAQICRARVLLQPTGQLVADMIEPVRMMLAPRLGSELPWLRRLRHDQAVYAKRALAIAEAVSQVWYEPATGRAPPADRAGRRSPVRLGWTSPAARPETSPMANANEPENVSPDDSYTVFTRAYDRELRIDALVRAASLSDYRAEIEKALAGLSISLPRLTREIVERIALPARRGWIDAQEEGYIDGRRLARFIANPADRQLFRRERFEPVTYCQLAILVDCSGSMKRYAQSIGLVVDLMVRALEQAGVASEILGFTTGTWNGGRARRDWMHSGQPRRPGRLNELCHLIFKDAAQSWRQARRALAGFLRADLFREAIDGEAVGWACERLRAGTDRDTRRILLVVSDGCPMDSATAQANGDEYLDSHLEAVIEREVRRRDIEICAIGVGAHLGRYYERRLQVDLARPPDFALLQDIVRLVAHQPIRSACSSRPLPPGVAAVASPPVPDSSAPMVHAPTR